MTRYFFVICLLILLPGCVGLQPDERDFVTSDDIVAADVMRQMRGEQVTEY